MIQAVVKNAKKSELLITSNFNSGLKNKFQI